MPKLRFVLAICFSAIVSIAFAHDRVEEGYIHFDEHQLNEVQSLNGKWHFYWQKSYEDYRKGNVGHPSNINVPGAWNEEGFPVKGYGLYHVKIVVSGIAGEKLAVRVGDISSNYNLYINNRLAQHSGYFNTAIQLSEPDYNPQCYAFRAQSDTIDLFFEVSNNDYREGGINYRIEFTKSVPMILSFNQDLVLEAFLTGILLLMFLYFLVFYFIRQNDRSPLYFALLCLVSALRVVTTGTILIRQMDIPMNWEWMFKLELGSILCVPMFGGLYLFNLLDQTKWKKILIASNTVVFVFLILAIVLDNFYASYLIPPFRYLAFFQLVFLMVMVVRVMIQSKHYLAKLAVIGYVFVFVFGINDILYSRGTIETMYLMPIGILAYVFIQTIVLTQKFTESFQEVERLSGQLREVNKNQEFVIKQRTKELANYNDIRDKIFSIIGHDLRAPIATLSSVLSLADQADDKTILELRSYFKGIKRNVDNLNLTIDNLLIWSQNQINGVRIKPVVLNVRDEVEQVVSLYSLIAFQKEIMLVHQILEPFPVIVDHGHLNLILRNLISNSLKFTNVGGSIVITCATSKSGVVKICIKDNGIGIEKERIEQLFDPQFHITTQGTMNEKGTGLGLRLCKEYAEKNGGSIWIESELGMGTKVCIELPSAY